MIPTTSPPTRQLYMLPLAIGAVLIGSALSEPALAEASSVNSALHSAEQQQTTQTAQYYQVPAGNLGTALNRLAQQAGIAISFRADDVEGIQVKGLEGNYRIEAAFAALLEGHRLTAQATPSGYVVRENTGILEPTTDDQQVFRFPPVKVTAEKIERSYLDTHSSIGIVSAEDLKTFNIGDLSDAYQQLANVRSFPNRQGNNGFMIRGMNADGVTQPGNSAPLISVVIDGVTQSAEGLKRGSRGVWDIDSIQVLRGPQSTIQGRNSLAGAVVVKTKNPSWEPEFSVKAIYGELDREEVALAVSAPIIDDELAFRLSGEYRTKTTDIDVLDAGNKPLMEDEYHNIRGKLLYTPESVDGLRALLTVNQTFDSPTAAAVSGPDFFEREFNGASVFTEFREMDVNNYSADIAYELSEHFTLRSVTTYNDTDLEISSAPSSAVFQRKDHREDGDITQEFRLEIEEEISGLSGVAGLMYGSFEQDIVSDINYYNGAFIQKGTTNRETETTALYADLRLRVAESFRVIVGGRYQYDEVRNKVDFETTQGAVVADEETDFEVFLPKLGFAYDMTESQVVALTATRGYRQGFTESQVGTNNVLSIDPEFLWTYEISYRFESPDNRLTAGVNLFYNDYKDQQVVVLNPDLPPLGNTRNAGDSSSYGAELEASYRVNDEFKVFGALGLLETELDDFDAGCADGSCEGNAYTEAPKVTASLGVSYQNSSGFFANLSANYTDSYYGDIQNSEILEVDSRFLANVKFGYKFAPLTVGVYINNVFDKDYVTGVSSFSGVIDTSSQATIGNARNAGIEIRLDF